MCCYGDTYRPMLRCNLDVLFYTRVLILAPSGGQKMFQKVILIATEGSANVVLKISQAILINDSSFQCYFRRMD